jgi:hypothetical protein
LSEIVFFRLHFRILLLNSTFLSLNLSSELVISDW